MGLSIRILKGKREGEEFRLADGLRIGRKRADINLFDSRVSNLHALIQEDKLGNFSIIDTNSTNKIQYNGQSLEQLKLKPGMQFYLGNSLIEVFDPNEEAFKENPWAKNLAKVLKSLLQHYPEKTVELGAAKMFERCVLLRFIGGPQKNEEWVLAYGPRKIGSHCLGTTLIDNKALPESFEIHACDKRVEFLTKHPEVVKLNGQSLETSLLHEGDIISIGQSEIEVSYS